MKLVLKEKKLFLMKKDISVGYITFDINEADNSVYIHFFKIYEKYQGFGLGTFMLEEMISFFKKNSFKSIYLEVDNCFSNIDRYLLVNFYKKFGFLEVFENFKILKLMVHPEGFEPSISSEPRILSP